VNANLMRKANERLVIVGALSVATSICIAFEWFREWHFGSSGFRFLLWNLFLAWIPVVLALVIFAHYLRGRAPGRMLVPGVIWLLFLPNAPYLFTDFIHLSPTAGVPLWFDGTVLSAFAWTGALLCLVSVYLVHSAIRNWYGAVQGWMTVVVVLIFTSVGVYAGRFLRLNSWDAFIHPGRILRQVASSFDEPLTVIRGGTATVVVATMLAVTYVTFYAVISMRPASDRARELD
jgi:uncharacterized membrane protein